MSNVKAVWRKSEAATRRATKKEAGELLQGAVVAKVSMSGVEKEGVWFIFPPTHDFAKIKNIAFQLVAQGVGTKDYDNGVVELPAYAGKRLCAISLDPADPLVNDIVYRRSTHDDSLTHPHIRNLETLPSNEAAALAYSMFTDQAKKIPMGVKP